MRSTLSAESVILYITLRLSFAHAFHAIHWIILFLSPHLWIRPFCSRTTAVLCMSVYLSQCNRCPHRWFYFNRFQFCQKLNHSETNILHGTAISHFELFGLFSASHNHRQSIDLWLSLADPVVHFCFFIVSSTLVSIFPCVRVCLCMCVRSSVLQLTLIRNTCWGYQYSTQLLRIGPWRVSIERMMITFRMSFSV